MTLYLFSFYIFLDFFSVYSLKETKLFLLLHSFILGESSRGMCLL